jgi:hypothetical protein
LMARHGLKRTKVETSVLLGAVVLVFSLIPIMHICKSSLGLGKLWDDYHQEIELLGLGLALVAYTDAKRQLARQEVTIESLTTKSTGWFPYHLDAIARLVDACDSSLDILGDGVDYGSFFAPADHKAIYEKIIWAAVSKPKKVRVRLLICGGPASITKSSPFFGKSLDTLRSEPKPRFPGARSFDEHLAQYLDFLRTEKEDDFREWIKSISDADPDSRMRLMLNISHGLPQSGENHTVPNDLFHRCLNECRPYRETKTHGKITDDYVFHALLQLRHEWFKRKLECNGIKIHYVEEEEAVHFWLRDKQEAHFTYTNAAERRGRGFITSDPAFTETYIGIFESRWP